MNCVNCGSKNVKEIYTICDDGMEYNDFYFCKDCHIRYRYNDLNMLVIDKYPK